MNICQEPSVGVFPFVWLWIHSKFKSHVTVFGGMLNWIGSRNPTPRWRDIQKVSHKHFDNDTMTHSSAPKKVYAIHEIPRKPESCWRMTRNEILRHISIQIYRNLFSNATVRLKFPNPHEFQQITSQHNKKARKVLIFRYRLERIRMARGGMLKDFNLFRRKS